MVKKEFQKAYLEWVNNQGLIECPQCESLDIVNITIPYEGRMLICRACRNRAKIGEEDEKKQRRGFKL